jgi:hypothetical protein
LGSFGEERDRAIYKPPLSKDSKSDDTTMFDPEFTNMNLSLEEKNIAAQKPNLFKGFSFTENNEACESPFAIHLRV